MRFKIPLFFLAFILICVGIYFSFGIVLASASISAGATGLDCNAAQLKSLYHESDQERFDDAIFAFRENMSTIINHGKSEVEKLLWCGFLTFSSGLALLLLLLRQPRKGSAP